MYTLKLKYQKNYTTARTAIPYTDLDNTAPKPTFSKVKESNSVVASISFILDTVAYNYFMAFYRTATKLGAQAFQMYLPDDTNTLQLTVVHFVPGTIQLVSTEDGLYFNIAAEVEYVPPYMNSSEETTKFNTYQEQYT